MHNPEPNLFIRYKGVKLENDSDIDLALLGESIIGFNRAIKEIIKISKINGEVSINAVSVRNGSVIFDLIVNFVTHSSPFNNYQDYLNFVSIASHETYSKLILAHRNLNDYVAKDPLDFAVECWMLSKFYVRMMKWARSQKNTVVILDEEKNVLPKDYAIKLHKLTKNKVYKKALKPFIESEVKEIEVSADREFEQKVNINEENFEDYLGEDEQILPEFENGKIYNIAGKIVGLESSKGESLKFKADDIDKRYSLLVANLDNESKSEDFIEFYKKDVNVLAEVIRKSLYQKPKLIIRNIDLKQKALL
jgi:hypothetical protein